MAHQIKRLVILILGLWLVTAGLWDPLAEAAAGSKSPGYSRPTSSPSKKRLGQPQRGGELRLFEAGGPHLRWLYQTGHQPDRPRRLYQTGRPLPPAAILNR